VVRCVPDSPRRPSRAKWPTYARRQSGLPPGVRAEVGGPAASSSTSPTRSAASNSKLLFATILVVALVLIITIEVVLWLVPLVVIGIADQAASAIVYLLASHAGLVVNGESAGILRVLVFGAGTDYALLLIARYREELRENEDRHDAMRRHCSAPSGHPGQRARSR